LLGLNVECMRRNTGTHSAPHLLALCKDQRNTAHKRSDRSRGALMSVVHFKIHLRSSLHALWHCYTTVPISLCLHIQLRAPLLTSTDLSMLLALQLVMLELKRQVLPPKKRECVFRLLTRAIALIIRCYM